VKTVISTDRAAAVELLRKGDVVALPTETVYGLAANALDPIAVAKIFDAKERPRFDPLIVHLPNREWLDRIVELPADDRQLIAKLADKFWPGPFTMVLPKREIVPDIVTAGLDTVAVRLSAHPLFSEIVAELDKPLAAPSANRFGRVSPTTAQHVFDELHGRISLIIDAGPTEHGIESTIVAVREGEIAILRRGPVTDEQLSQFAEVCSSVAAANISSPGQLPSHYMPTTPLRLVDNAGDFFPQKNQRVGLLAWHSRGGDVHMAQRGTEDRILKFAAVRNLSPQLDLREAAANLFRYLRELDALNLDLIVVERVPSHALGAAIMDRLERASHR
jgi:L-threonylcarbamoyladenylate synthase